MIIEPSGEILGATVTGVDLGKPLGNADFAEIVQALGRHGVLCFKDQKITPEQQADFAKRFGTLEINVAAGPYTVPGLPEVMILSNIVKYGRPVEVCPASYTPAMQGWSMSARVWRSAWNRAITPSVSIPRLMSLRATSRRRGAVCSAR